MIKIGYFADGKWSHEAFNKIINDSDLSFGFVCVRYGSTDDTLRQLCYSNNIPLLKVANVNSPEFIIIVKEYDCDIFVSMSFDQIFKESLINIPRYKTINCHAGKLPFYRGRNVLNWALINDEPEFGITVHFVDSGVDTGDIIDQIILPISDQDDYCSLLERSYIGCANILYTSIKKFETEDIECTPQKNIHTTGSYCIKRISGDEVINWNQSSRELFNFIRGISLPGPRAQSRLNNKLIKINKSKMVPNAYIYRGIPGSVVGKSPESIFVKTIDSILEIVDYEYDGIIKIGDRFDR